MDFRIFFSIGNFHIYWYSFLIFVAFLTAYIFSILKAKLKQIPTAPVENFIFIVLPSSIIGARLWYVIGNLNQINSFWEIFILRNGGIAIEGGLVFGIISGCIWFYFQSKKYDVNYLKYADCIVPNILLAQAIGRWGNFFNQEVLGNISNDWNWLPSFIKDHLHLVNEDKTIVRTPLFLVESFFNLTGWMLLTFLLPYLNQKKQFLKNADIAFAYLIYYGLLRSILEPFRSSEYIMKVGPVPISIVLSIIFVVIGIVFIYLNQTNKLTKFLNKHLKHQVQ